MKLDFVNLHGLGNDFVFVDDFARQIELTPDQVLQITPNVQDTCTTSIRMARLQKCVVMAFAASPSSWLIEGMLTPNLDRILLTPCEGRCRFLLSSIPMAS